MANTRPMGRIRPGTLLLPGGSAMLSLNCSGVVTFTQSQSYIRPFEGNREADVAPGENEFDAPVLDYKPGLIFAWEIKFLSGNICVHKF